MNQECRAQEIQAFQTEKYLNDKDYYNAIEIFRRLANKDYAPAQDKLALMYQTAWGIEQSYTQAVCQFYKAAEQGNTESGKIFVDTLSVIQYPNAKSMFIKTLRAGYTKTSDSNDDYCFYVNNYNLPVWRLFS